ncbi:MAG TPA: EF-P lysine aminoacylase EpmA [Alphaproteobacteria bacterium]|nr:EF-P lysine aminoacylase EpmA [Alphaproteobacteria bacterium]
MWWKPEAFASKKEALRCRMGLIRAIRAFFDAQEFWEVETPALQTAPGMEPHLWAFETERLSPDRIAAERLYLHTSPEFAMKKLLVAGAPDIYQIAHVFRNAEGSSLHTPEFTMLEWYRPESGYRQIMDDCVGLLRACAENLKIDTYSHRGVSADPFGAWEIISVCEAFETYADFRLEDVLPENAGGEREAARLFSQKLSATGLHTASDDRWDDLFFRLFAARIEPALGCGRPTILYDYPISMAALARPSPEDPRFAERFEMYVCGIELANAFGELTDPAVQRRRFEADMTLKEQLYGERWPIDEDFIAALSQGMPDSAGIALGIDRLAMLATGAESIQDVQWCGPARGQRQRRAPGPLTRRDPPAHQPWTPDADFSSPLPRHRTGTE